MASQFWICRASVRGGSGALSGSVVTWRQDHSLYRTSGSLFSTGVLVGEGPMAPQGREGVVLHGNAAFFLLALIYHEKGSQLTWPVL